MLRPDELQDHITDTYFALRRGLVVLSVLLPLVLLGLGAYWHVSWQPSLSHYYANGTDGTRDWFVGTLFATGALLYNYKGFSTLENVALNVAGLFVTGVAWFPCKCNNPDTTFTPHGFLAVSFFLIMAFVCVYCAPETLELMQDLKKRARFARLYRIIGGVLIASPVAAFAVNAFLHQNPNDPSHVVFLVEAFGIWTFAAYWFVKSRELAATQAEKLAAAGRARRTQSGRITPAP